MAIYKIIKSITKNYYGDVITEFLTTSNFNDVIEAKSIKSKFGIIKKRFQTVQADRLSSIYPNSIVVAEFFGLSTMPNIDDDIQPSSWTATMKYIERMYGIDYAKSFDRADYPQLSKAA